MSTQTTPIVSEVTVSSQENEFKDALSIVELEERFELTAASEDSARCIIFADAAVQ